MTRPALAVPARAGDDRDYHNPDCVNVLAAGLVLALAAPVIAGLAVRASIRAVRAHTDSAIEEDQ